jgi:hypothetical protein
MTHFSATYGMVGIGIAAAIGFVLALNFLSSSTIGGTSGINESPQVKDSQPSTFSLKQQNAPQPSLDNNSGEDVSTFAGPSSQSTARIEAGTTNESGSPTLTSLIALTGTSERISEVTKDMEFKLGAPVFIQANFENHNEAAISNHTIVIDIKSNDGGENESIANFRGDIAAGSSIAIESYWKPAKVGNYIVTVFSMTLEEQTATVPVSPVAAIPIKVVQ